MSGRRIRGKIQAGIIAGLIIFSFVSSNEFVEASSTVSPQSICDVPVKVMPLGDSITVGKYSGINTSDGADADDIGYRKDLWDLLDIDGYTVDFVGTNSNGITYPFSDPQHEGHNGWRDDQIADNIYNNGGTNFLSLNPPDVVLLHIGTNSLSADASDVENILNEIDEYEADTSSSVVVIVAKIINQVPYNNLVTQFNNNVQSMVQARADYGGELFMVDMEVGAGLNYSIWPGDPSGDMIDNLHPYATGYTKMAGVWKAKFDQIYASCGTNNPPNVTNPGTQNNAEGNSVSLQIIADDDDGDPITYSAMNLPDGLSINPSTGLISGSISQTAAQGSPHNTQVSVRDGKPLGTTTVSFSWNVSAVNVKPVIQHVPNQNSAESNVISLQINVTDEDNDTLTFSAGGLPPDLSIDQNGLISGKINYDASDSSPYSVTVTVEDDGSPQMGDTEIFTWNVANTNRAPVLNITPADRQDDEGTTLNPPIIITASDPDGDNLIFAASDLPPGVSIQKVNPNKAEISGTISYNATQGQPSFEYDVQIIVSDDGVPSLSDQDEFRWIVDDVNAAPQIVDPGTVISHLGEEVALQIEVYDPDGDNLTYRAEGLPPNLTIHPSTGLISGLPPNWAMNESPFTVKVSVIDDGDSPQSSSVIFNWIVKIYEVFMPVIVH